MTPFSRILLLASLACAAEIGAAAKLWAQTPDSLAGVPPASEPVSAAAVSRPGTVDRAVSVLARHGYANVAAVVDGEHLVVTFENARYRDERKALREAARLLSPERDAGRELVLVPTSRGIPLVAARYPRPGEGGAPETSRAGDPLPAPDVSLDLSGLPPALRAAGRASSSFGRADVVVHPWVEVRLGLDHDNPTGARMGVAPELRVALRPGLSLSAQVLLALQDDLPSGESRIRPALVTLNQIVRLPRNVFLSATAGTFTPNRYGVDVEARAYFRNGRWSAGAQLGLTGATSFAREGWSFAPVRDRTILADVAWRVPRYDLTLRTTAGAFLNDERGVRLDASRQFGEAEVGWFLFKSEAGANGGLVLRIPLQPGKHAMPGPVRLRVADTFRWEYRYRGAVGSGRSYRSGNALEDMIRRLNPDFVESDEPRAAANESR